MGRLDRQKGFDLAIAALAQLRHRYSNLRLVVAGDGPERDHLRALACARGVDDCIDFLGEVDTGDVGALLRACTVLVMPSRFEGLPLVALEAAWAGRPIVAAESPGLTDAVVPGETALTVPAEDADALASGIAALLADPGRAGELGRRARAVAERRYSLDRCVDEYERLYHQVVTGRVC
jgi:glycogen(starch) synthase